MLGVHIAETLFEPRIAPQLDRHGAGWESLRNGVGSGDGWPLYLERYAELLMKVRSS